MTFKISLRPEAVQHIAPQNAAIPSALSLPSPSSPTSERSKTDENIFRFFILGYVELLLCSFVAIYFLRNEPTTQFSIKRSWEPVCVFLLNSINRLTSLIVVHLWRLGLGQTTCQVQARFYLCVRNPDTEYIIATSSARIRLFTTGN